MENFENADAVFGGLCDLVCAYMHFQMKIHRCIEVEMIRKPLCGEK